MPSCDEPVLGGIHICRPARIHLPKAGPVGLQLMSDLHLGAAGVDYKRIDHEIDRAVENGDRVLINGDLLDLILPKDAKRYDPGAIHPRLAGRTDPINAAVKWAVEILAPAAHLIDMIGVGNHETATTKWHGVDVTLLIIYELQKLAVERNPEHTIHYGGYTGFVDYRISVGSNGCRFVIYYHHGSGGASPVTKGLIDFNRKDVWLDGTDLIWMGHKHNRLADAVERVSCPLEGDDISVLEVKHVMTGAYFKTYAGQSQESVRRHGRRSNYAADMGLAPQGKGGVRAILHAVRDGNKRIDLVI